MQRANGARLQGVCGHLHPQPPSVLRRRPDIVVVYRAAGSRNSARHQNHKTDHTKTLRQNVFSFGHSSIESAAAGEREAPSRGNQRLLMRAGSRRLESCTVQHPMRASQAGVHGYRAPPVRLHEASCTSGTAGAGHAANTQHAVRSARLQGSARLQAIAGGAGMQGGR